LESKPLVRDSFLAKKTELKSWPKAEGFSLIPKENNNNLNTEIKKKLKEFNNTFMI